MTDNILAMCTIHASSKVSKPKYHYPRSNCTIKEFCFQKGLSCAKTSKLITHNPLIKDLKETEQSLCIPHISSPKRSGHAGRMWRNHQ